jgi:uncharacterized protein
MEDKTAGYQPFHVMAKPLGSRCNLDCTYCYYLPKKELLGDSPPGAEFRGHST